MKNPWITLPSGVIRITAAELEGSIRRDPDGTFSAWIDQVNAAGVRFPAWDGHGYKSLRTAKLACRSALAWDARKSRMGIPRPVGLLRGSYASSTPDM
jgi:hypothetical protein